MKQLLFTCCLILGINYLCNSQNKISTYKGKKWEQLEGSGKIITINQNLLAFDTIKIDNVNLNIRIQTGAEVYAMHISIDDNLKDFFKWSQAENTLKLSFDMSGGKYPRWLSRNNTIITIAVPLIEKLVNKGNSDLEINLSEQSKFNLITDGNPDIKITGIVKEFILQSTGNSDIKAGNLDADKIILTTNGNADIELKTKCLVEKEIRGNNDIINLYAESDKENKIDCKLPNEAGASLVSFRIKNKHALPAKFTLVSYRPDMEGNGTVSFILIGLGSKKFMFPAGTRIYLATSEQVNTIMSGATIINQEPFLVVKNEDAGKTFTIK